MQVSRFVAVCRIEQNRRALDSLSMHLRDDFDLATVPAFAADSVAAAIIERSDRQNDDRTAFVANAFHQTSGIELRGPFHWRMQSLPAGGYYIIAAHSFTSPAVAECDVSVIAYRYAFSRAVIRDLAAWFSFDLGVRRARVRLPAGDIQAASLVQRLGFREVGAPLTDGETGTVWSASPDDLLLFGYRPKA